MDITIERVNNGWIIKPMLKPYRGEPWVQSPSHDQIFVFTDIGELRENLQHILALEYPATERTV